MSASTPSAPPLRGTAPVSGSGASTAATRPAAFADPHSIVEAIASYPDPASLLTYVALAVASRSATAAEQGVLLNKVQTACSEQSRRVREVLLDAVDHSPGGYDGFEVVARAGSRSVDYARLESYPEIYGEVVKVGSPTLVVRYPSD